jgi:hypothetical protein
MLNKIYSPIITIFSVITIVVSLTMVQAQTTKETNNSQSIDDKEKDYFSKLRDTFPIVEYSKPSSLEGESEERKLKTKRLCTESAEVSFGLKVQSNYSRINLSLSLFDGFR